MGGIVARARTGGLRWKRRSIVVFVIFFVGFFIVFVVEFGTASFAAKMVARGVKAEAGVSVSGCGGGSFGGIGGEHTDFVERNSTRISVVKLHVDQKTRRLLIWGKKGRRMQRKKEGRKEGRREGRKQGMDNRKEGWK